MGVIPILFAPEAELTQTEAKMLEGLSVSHGLLGLKKLNVHRRDCAAARALRLLRSPARQRAQELGIALNTLKTRMKKLGIE